MPAEKLGPVICCFEAASESDLGPLTYNSSSTEVRKSSHEDSDDVVAGL